MLITFYISIYLSSIIICVFIIFVSNLKYYRFFKIFNRIEKLNIKCVHYFLNQPLTFDMNILQ